MSASAIRAGRAFVELFTKDDALRKGLAAAQARIQAFGKGVEKASKAFLAVGVGIGVPMLLAAKSFADAGSGLVDMSQRTGVAVEKLSALKFAAGQSGTSLEGLEKGLRKMQRTISDAAAGSAAAEKAILQMDMAVEDLVGLSADEAFLKIADHISRVPDAADRAALAMDIFGKSGADLLPLMINGAEGINDLMAAAHRAGLVLGKEDAEAAEKFGNTIDALGTSMKGIVIAVGSALAPSLQEVADSLMAGSGNLRLWIQQHEGAIVAVGKLAVALVALSGPLKMLSVMASGLDLAAAFIKNAGAVGTMTTAVGALALATGEAIRQTKEWQGVQKYGTPWEKGLQTLLTPTAAATQYLMDKINPPRTDFQQQRDVAVGRITSAGLGGKLSTEAFNKLADDMARAMVNWSPHEALRLLEEAKKSAEAAGKAAEAAKEAAQAAKFEPSVGERAALDWYLNQEPRPMDEFDQRRLGYQLEDAEAKRREPDLLLAEERDQMLYEWGQDMKEAILERDRELQQSLDRQADTLTAGSEAAAKAFLDNMRADNPALRVAERQAKAAEDTNRHIVEMNRLLSGPLPVSCDGHNVGF